MLALLAAILAGHAAWGWLRPSERPDPDRLSVVLGPDEQPYTYAWTSPVAISPDGRLLAFTAARGATTHLYTRALGDYDERELPGTDGAHSPFFSPDGEWVGYFTANRLWKVSVAGGAPVPVCDVLDERFGGAWGPGDTIVFADRAGLMRVDASGSSPQVLRPLHPDSGETAVAFPQFLPGGAVLSTVLGTSGQSRTEVVDPDGGTHVVLDTGIGTKYLPSGHLLYAESGVLQTVAFDLGRLRVRSSPVPVPEKVYLTPLGSPMLSVAANGTLVYIPAGGLIRSAVIGETGTLVRVAFDGTETTLWQDWSGGVPSISPDGRRAAAQFRPGQTQDGSNFHVWVLDLQRHTRQRLTSEATNIYPIWTPDGRRISFSSSRDGAMSLFWAPADGSGGPEPLLIRDGEQFGTSWSPDGRTLAFHQRDARTRFDIWLLHLDEIGAPEPFIHTGANETGLEFSPRDNLVAYTSDESGRSEVYVRPYPGGGERRIVSTAGGRSPHWAPDGSRLFYQQHDSLLAVTLQTEPTLEIGTPELLFEGRYGAGFAVDPRGRGLVMIRIDPPAEQSRFDVVLNWFTELRRLVPSESN